MTCIAAVHASELTLIPEPVLSSMLMSSGGKLSCSVQVD